MKKNISIIKKKNCFGCYACINACAKHCISMFEDKEGFRYPQIDLKKCNYCGACLAACPANKAKYDNNILEEPYTYSTYALDNEICKESSSGGIFSLLANYVLAQQGMVFGAIWGGTDYVKHTKATNTKELAPLRKSKYLQSDIGFTFREVKAELKKNKLVLYVGTPCQIAGLRTFLQKDYENLFAADLICMGVQSSTIFRRFLAEKEVEYKSKPIAYYRDKSKGWAPVVFTMDFENGQSIHFQYETNIYNHAFKQRLICRPSCDFCPFAQRPRTGDITIGDDWFYYGTHKNDTEKLQRGMSYISANTDKGLRILSEIEPYCAPAEKARLNVGWQHQKNYARKAFWRYVQKHEVLESIDKYTINKPLFFVALEKCIILKYFINRVSRLAFTKEGQRKFVKKIFSI
jgi:coenzyme F420-reducing hydrogenase beta subunit